MEPLSFGSLLYPDAALEGLYGWLSIWSHFNRTGTATGFSDEYRGLLRGRIVETMRSGPGGASERPQIRLPQFAYVDRQGVPLHRILLVFAPASSGKTSAVLAAVRSFGFSPFVVHAASGGKADLQEDVGKYVQKTETPSILGLFSKAQKPPREFLIVDDVDCCPDGESLNFLLSLASSLYYKQSLKSFLPKRAVGNAGEDAEGGGAAGAGRSRKTRAPLKQKAPSQKPDGRKPLQQRPVPAIFVATNPFALGLKPLREKALLMNLRFPDPQKVFLRVSALYPGLSGAEVTSSLNRAVEIANGNMRFLMTSLDTLLAMIRCGESISLSGAQQSRSGKAMSSLQDKGLSVRAVEAIMLARSAGGSVGLARAVLLRSLVFALMDETSEFSSLPARNSSALVAQVKACGVEVPYLASLYSLPALARLLTAKNYDQDSLQAALRRIEETADQTILHYKFTTDREIPSNLAISQFYDDMSFLHSSWTGSGGSVRLPAMSALLGLYVSLADSPFHSKAHESVYRALAYPAASGYVNLKALNAYYAELYDNESIITLDPGSEMRIGEGIQNGGRKKLESEAKQEAAVDSELGRKTETSTTKTLTDPISGATDRTDEPFPASSPALTDMPSLYSLLGARRDVYFTEYLPYSVLVTTSSIPDTGNFSLLSPDLRNSLISAVSAECHLGIFDQVDKVSAAQEKELERQERMRSLLSSSGAPLAARFGKTPTIPSCLAETLKNVMAYSEGKQSFVTSYCRGESVIDAAWARQKVWDFVFRRLTRNSVILFLSLSKSLRALQAAARGRKLSWSGAGCDLDASTLSGPAPEQPMGASYVSPLARRIEAYQKFLEAEVLRQFAQSADKAVLGLSRGQGQVRGVVYEFHEGTTQAVRRRMCGKDVWCSDKMA